MLQAISPKHDAHHERRRKNSLANLTASLRDGKVHLLLAASGSVATIKLPLIIESLAQRHESRSGKELSIRVLLTPSATRFLAGQSHEQPNVSSLLSMPCVDGVYEDADEWKEPWKRGDSILHIELRRWADLLVIAPLSANTLAKIVGGFADSLLTSVVRAWDAWGDLDYDAATNGNQPLLNGDRRRRQKKRILVAPAMNTAMWRHPVTAKSLRVLEEEWGINSRLFNQSASKQPTIEEEVQKLDEPQKETGNEEDGGWFEVLKPQQKTLACGDVGDGAMMDWRDIVAVVEDRLGLS
ncbi:flavoprotein, partial [Hypoxylon trugodes]|uniref:flavoprotein n=1 Tax=Hypoxylon trugodes TaxID=326681 RepID=UPI0021903E20